MTQFEIIQTEDGSLTIYDTKYNETFHSKYGALNESLYVFIEQGLKRFSSKSSLNILEIGFGTGLNAYLTFYHKPQHQFIYYEAIDLYPINRQQYEIFVKSLDKQGFYLELMQAKWNKEQKIANDFTVYKRNEDLINTEYFKMFDLVYFDAFSPKTQPELWTVKIFQNIFWHLNNGGALVTYASSGMVKQNLRTAGFVVERLHGPPHKHHMLRALKS